MKRFSVLLLLLYGFTYLHAEIGVEYFHKQVNDMDARITCPMKDPNGEPCALIKVVTSQTGFTFDCGLVGIMKIEQHPSEIWVFVPYGVKRITISHQQLGVLRDYFFPEPIEKATVYLLKLISGRIETTLVEEIASQWLVINPEPSDAAVYVNDEFKKTGIFSAKVKAGRYNYRVEAPLFHPEAGKVDVVDAKVTLDVQLRPAFGYLTVNTVPEGGARIVIDGKPLTQITPCKTEAFASGNHTVQVLKDMYAPSIQNVTVYDGKTTPVNFILQPTFAELSITGPSDAALYVNNLYKGKGTWQGRVNSGVYTVEARMDSYRTARKDIELTVGDKKTVELQLVPYYGSLDVISQPLGASITIDGKDNGITPNTINKLLIGEHKIQLSKPGYATICRTVNVEEEKSSELNEILSNGRAVSITSDPTSVDLYVDDQRVGVTPYGGSLTFGSHTFRIELNGRRANKTIIIDQTDTVTDFRLSFGPKSFTQTVNNLKFDMVGVVGGTFQMGSNKGDSDEKPICLVNVGDYLIGKTEVTQALWQSVMGNNPSYFKGENLPVEKVSWSECQTFVAKLNKLTGKTYRLPSEAEWEFAAHGGDFSKGYRFSGSNNAKDVAWFGINCNGSHAVAGKQPNELGLYDMSGNVWEWNQNLYGSYNSKFLENPAAISSGSRRVYRGGSWGSFAQDCRVTNRRSDRQDYCSDDLGLRLVLDQ